MLEACFDPDNMDGRDYILESLPSSKLKKGKLSIEMSVAKIVIGFLYSITLKLDNYQFGQSLTLSKLVSCYMLEKSNEY